MDRHLRRLQRVAKASPEDINAQHRYIAALERALRGADEPNHPILRDANIASAWVKDRELERQIIVAARDLLGSSKVVDESGNHMGVLINVHYENDFDPDDFEGMDMTGLPPELDELLDQAADLGYSMVVFWV